MSNLFKSVAIVSKLSSVLYNSINRMSSSKSFKPVTHVIFDMDGLILDTEYIYEGSVDEICESFGKKYPRETRMKVMGTTDRQSATIIINDIKLPLSIDEFLSKQKEICRKKFTKLDLLPGAERLLRHLHKTNVPFCLATSSGKQMTDIKVANYPELFNLFSHKVMGSTDPEVKMGKPAPDIFLIAADRFPDKPDPCKCLVFEDSPNGVRGAIKAGMQAVMVPDEIVSLEERAEATVVLESLEQFKPEEFGLPKF